MGSGPLQSVGSHLLAVFLSTSLLLLPFLTPAPLHFSVLRTGLYVHSERQWKEMLVLVAGMSGQMGKRKED